MVDILVLKQKMSQLAEYLVDLQELKNDSELTWIQFKSDKKIRRYTERTLHLAIECCLDIGGHIIADEGFREPRNNRDIFLVLCENEIIAEESLVPLQRMAQFRNILVHDYAKLDADIVYSIIEKHLLDIICFAGDIRNTFLGENESDIDS
ncbi:MAG TPA: DUF86 domain-containing protein [Negativicutes bacterium]